MKLELNSLTKAISTLDRILGIYPIVLQKPVENSVEIEAIQSGVIQRFEVAYEQCWKFMKRWIEENVGSQEVDGVPRRELFRIGAENHLINSVDEWMEFHKAGNLTSHTYDEDNAKYVFSIALLFLPKAKLFLQNLDQRNV